jgi:hypothetical protein
MSSEENIATFVIGAIGFDFVARAEAPAKIEDSCFGTCNGRTDFVTENCWVKS